MQRSLHKQLNGQVRAVWPELHHVFRKQTMQLVATCNLNPGSQEGLGIAGLASHALQC